MAQSSILSNHQECLACLRAQGYLTDREQTEAS